MTGHMTDHMILHYSSPEQLCYEGSEILMLGYAGVENVAPCPVNHLGPRCPPTINFGAIEPLDELANS